MKRKELSLDEIWRRFERTIVRRERSRLIRKGFICPAARMTPQMLVRNPDAKGGWSPHIG